NSASASEIFSGAIQDYGIGTIMGTQTFGKGIVQSVIPLYDGSAMKLTVSNYYTPKGRSIHKVGITPDVVIELDKSLTGVITEEQDNQLQSAVQFLKKQIGK
ncbi:MAG: S41 family peptidase, partial [Clostridiales bacterium]|nr:S41 family peptidase [Clostridiales bacterium]